MVRKILGAFFFALILACNAYGQADPSAREDIAKLLSDFQVAANSGMAVDQFFAPAARVRGQSQIQSLQAKRFLTFVITDYNLQTGLKFTDSKQATLPVTVSWKTSEEEASKTEVLVFAEDHGSWYFSDPGFWMVSIVWIVPVLIFAVAYGLSLTYMYLHSNRQRWVSAKKKTQWQFLALVPFSILFYVARKPWTKP